MVALRTVRISGAGRRAACDHVADATQAFSGFVVTTGTRSFPWHLFACAEMATINRARVFVVAIDVLRTQTTSQYATVLNALASVTETKARSIDLGAFLRRWRRLLR